MTTLKEVREMIVEMIDDPSHLSDWEFDFIDSVAELDDLTNAQRDKVVEIYDANYA